MAGMRVGVSLRSAYDVSDGRLGARWMVERAAEASAAGLDSLFVGDHHVTGSPYYQNTPVLGRLLAEWGDGPAGALFLLPLWHPVLLAEQVGTLATIATGRFILQCALGDGKRQFGAMGEVVSRRVGRFEAGLDIVRRLLAGEEVTTDATSPWPLQRARIAPRPPEPVEVWIGGGAPAAIDRAARVGDGWLAGPGLTLAQAGEQIEHYLACCRSHGRRPSAVAIRRDIHVGKDRHDADRVAGPVVASGYRGFPAGAAVIGGVDEVAEEFRRLAAMGFTDVIVRHLVDDQQEVLASLSRLAEVRSAVASA
jgi:alkanesulfonate monooxygenase SsuD/methylene tetrahydromethanopterin reductase-like flavin-dependent oxidoreductase (luciferase family)